MCIIILKPKNRNMPDDETLRECFKNNPHGSGFMYSDGKNVIIEKGFMDFNQLSRALSEISDVKNHNMVLHFRQSTHGAISPENCHPFPLSGDKKELKKLYNKTNIAMVHNGILQQYGRKNTIMSDTAFFAKLLSGLQSNKAIIRAIKAHNLYDNQRFIVMFSDGEIFKNGSFNKFHGCWYSNYSYKPREIIQIPDNILDDKNYQNGYQNAHVQQLQLINGQTAGIHSFNFKTVNNTKKYCKNCVYIGTNDCNGCEFFDPEQTTKRKFIDYLNTP